MPKLKRQATSGSWLQKICHHAISSRQSIVITLEISIGIVWCLGSLMLFVLLTDEMLERDFHRFDVMTSQLIYLLRSPGLTEVMKQITTLGSGISFVIMTLACVVFLIRHHKKEAILFSIALSMGVILNTVLKHAIQRPRPELSPLISETMSSFPSGHAMNSFIFFGLLSFFSYHFFRSKKLTLVITALSIVSILLVGFSRVYLGVHYPTDVLAGYVAGFWWFITILLIDRTLIFYRSFKKTE